MRKMYGKKRTGKFLDFEKVVMPLDKKQPVITTNITIHRGRESGDPEGGRLYAK